MKAKPGPRPSTKEYIAKWRTTVEDHLVTELDECVHRLVAADAEADHVSAQPGSLLVSHIAHALQLAASPTGGVESAVRYLQEAATPRDEEPPA